MLINFDEVRAKRLWRELMETHGMPPGVPVDPEGAMGADWKGWVAWLGVAEGERFDPVALKAKFAPVFEEAWAAWEANEANG